jgi:hypothetical protein
MIHAAARARASNGDGNVGAHGRKDIFVAR